MIKNLAVILAAVAIVSLAPIGTHQAYAGGAASAATKPAGVVAAVSHHHAVQTADSGITEFSSSSAKTSVSKR